MFLPSAASITAAAGGAVLEECCSYLEVFLVSHSYHLGSCWAGLINTPELVQNHRPDIWKEQQAILLQPSQSQARNSKWSNVITGIKLLVQVEFFYSTLAASSSLTSDLFPVLPVKLYSIYVFTATLPQTSILPKFQNSIISVMGRMMSRNFTGQRGM